MPDERSPREIIARLCGALGLSMPTAELLLPGALPAAFHALLVHNDGMTATLERHWGEPIAVRLLADDISVEHRALFRFVVLHTQSSAEAVEIAMIRIPLEIFTPPLRRRFIDARQPFGALLADAGIRFEAHPLAYFTTVADADLAAKCAVSEGTRLYGRVNQLLREDGALLCETVEVLPRA